MDSANPPGYDYGSVARSPVAWHDFEDLKRLLGFTERDQQLLNRAGGLIGPRFEELIGHWFGQIGPWVHATFAGPDAERYGAVAGTRFGRGIVDCFVRQYDQEWLDYQHEIGLRHHRARKNETDHVNSVPVVPLRHLVASVQVLSVIPDSFLEGATNDDIAGMRAAWSRSLLLQVALWSRAYVREDDW
jgi:hypothetical protein